MTELDFKTIGKKIKERRQALDITQEYVANRLDINPSHISNIECGRANPSLTAIVRIADILECSVDCFIGGEYTYEADVRKEEALNSAIMEKLRYFDADKKMRVLKMLDLL